MAFNQEEIINQLSNLTVVELVTLTKALEEKWGVKAGVSKTEAQDIEKKLKEAGAEVELK